VKGLCYYLLTIELAKLLLFIDNRKVVLNLFVMIGGIIGNLVSIVSCYICFNSIMFK